MRFFQIYQMWEVKNSYLKFYFNYIQYRTNEKLKFIFSTENDMQNTLAQRKWNIMEYMSTAKKVCDVTNPIFTFI